ncbi:hypothetical protein FGRMN_5558 [Fusarium graminum]|nr:hypothetical protein FGRMN_5558 [Fusarium graminum]
MDHFPFLRLPNELRHIVYQAYFMLTEGYSCNSQSGKLTTSDGEPIDLALMYTCSLIAAETKDLPLKHNIISFSTLHQADWSRLAGRFEYLRRAQDSLQLHLLITHGHHLTPQMWSQVRERFPWFVPNLQYTMQHRTMWFSYDDNNVISRATGGGDWTLRRSAYDVNLHIEGVTGSGYEASQAIRFALRLLAQKLGVIFLNPSTPTRRRPATSRRYGIMGNKERHFDIIHFINRCWEPWDIPTGPSIEYMGEIFADYRHYDFLQRWDETSTWEVLPSEYFYRSKFRFSAVSVAIRFLKSLPEAKLQAVRSIVVHEDHLAVGRQECHSHGLIPICKQNKRLHVTIRVGMLTNILMAGNVRDDAGQSLWAYREKTLGIHTRDLSRGLSGWLTEALATVDGGMPAGSYSLVFDAGTATKSASSLFQEVVQQDVAFYRAIERRFPGLLCRHDMGGLSRRFTEGVVHLMNQTSVMRCNFNPGVLHDVDGFVKQLSAEAERWEWEDEGDEASELNYLYSKLEAPGFDVASFAAEFANWEDEILSNWESCDLSEWHRHERARLAIRKSWRFVFEGMDQSSRARRVSQG